MSIENERLQFAIKLANKLIEETDNLKDKIDLYMHKQLMEAVDKFDREHIDDKRVIYRGVSNIYDLLRDLIEHPGQLHEFANAPDQYSFISLEKNHNQIQLVIYSLDKTKKEIEKIQETPFNLL